MSITKVGPGIEFLGVVPKLPEPDPPLSDKTAAVLDALRSNVESYSEVFEGALWRSVYLDNAHTATGVSGKAFGWHLRALTAAGLYRADDGTFGLVRMGQL